MMEKGYERFFWFLAIGLFLFHLLYIWLTPLDLAPDEAYYWDWSRNLALGYYSKPPMVAWVIAFFTHLGGDNPFFVRVGAVLFSLGSSIILFSLGRTLFNAKVGFWASLVANVSPGFAVGSVIMTIDPPLLFFWGLTIFLLQRALAERGKGYWYLAGVSLGLGLLSKYTMVALIPSLFLYLAFSPANRFWLKKKEPYLFILIGLFILVPNLYWNYINQWPSIKQPAGLVQDKGLSSLTTFIWFFGPQAGILSPITFLLVLYGLWQGGKRGMFNHDDRYLLLFCHSIPLFGFFLILSLFSVCYINWAAPAYFTAFILAIAIVLEGTWREKVKKWVLASAVLVGTIICLLAYNLDAIRSLSVSLGANIPAKKFPTSRLKGWRELGEAVTKLLDDVGREKTFVISHRRKFVSELAFYIKGQPPVYMLNLYGSLQSQYDLWEGFGNKIGFNALYITKLGYPVPATFAAAFNHVEEIKTVEIYTGKELVKGFSIFYCQSFRGFNQGP
jgi:4-amino-4-deoxy-L-arabinose transferase-like glycosyltransferase